MCCGFPDSVRKERDVGVVVHSSQPPSAGPHVDAAQDWAAVGADLHGERRLVTELDYVRHELPFLANVFAVHQPLAGCSMPGGVRGASSINCNRCNQLTAVS